MSVGGRGETGAGERMVVLYTYEIYIVLHLRGQVRSIGISSIQRETHIG